MLKIQKSQPSEILELYKIERLCHTEPWSLGILKDCFRVGYLSYTFTIPCPCNPNATIIIGFMILHVILDECHLLNLCIHPQHQRQGFAKKALAWLMKLLKTKSIHSIFLEVKASNDKAQNLYKQLGFEEISIRKNYYSTKNGQEDAIVMKSLL